MNRRRAPKTAALEYTWCWRRWQNRERTCAWWDRRRRPVSGVCVCVWTYDVRYLYNIYIIRYGNVILPGTVSRSNCVRARATNAFERLSERKRTKLPDGQTDGKRSSSIGFWVFGQKKLVFEIGGRTFRGFSGTARRTCKRRQRTTNYQITFPLRETATS